jgi:hypothetical protein
VPCSAPPSIKQTVCRIASSSRRSQSINLTLRMAHAYGASICAVLSGHPLLHGPRGNCRQQPKIGVEDSKHLAGAIIQNPIQADLHDGNWATFVARFAPDGTAGLTRCGITLFELANHLVDSHHMTHLISVIARRSEWKRSRGRRCGRLCWPSAAAVDGIQASTRAAARRLGLGRYVPDLSDAGPMAADVCLTLIYPFAWLPGLPVLPAAAIASTRNGEITYAKAVS